MKLYKTEALVLRSRDCGRGDKLLILYSRELGKIKVMAHGAARPSSRKRGAVQLFTRANFLIRRGREMDSVSQCEGVEMFSYLREDLEKISGPGDFTHSFVHLLHRPVQQFRQACSYGVHFIFFVYFALWAPEV
jgi:hypothetical protein